MSDGEYGPGNTGGLSTDLQDIAMSNQLRSMQQSTPDRSSDFSSTLEDPGCDVSDPFRSHQVSILTLWRVNSYHNPIDAAAYERETRLSYPAQRVEIIYTQLEATRSPASQIMRMQILKR